MQFKLFSALLLALWSIAVNARISSPESGDKWSKGSTQTISWDTSGLKAPMNIYVCPSRATDISVVIEKIAINIENSGSFRWNIEASLTVEEVTIIIQDSRNTLVISETLEILEVSASSSGNSYNNNGKGSSYDNDNGKGSSNDNNNGKGSSYDNNNGKGSSYDNNNGKGSSYDNNNGKGSSYNNGGSSYDNGSKGSSGGDNGSGNKGSSHDSTTTTTISTTTKTTTTTQYTTVQVSTTMVTSATTTTTTTTSIQTTTSEQMGSAQETTPAVVYYTTQAETTQAYYTQQAESTTSQAAMVYYNPPPAVYESGSGLTTVQLTSVIQQTITETYAAWTATVSQAGISVAVSTPPPYVLQSIPPEVVTAASSFVALQGINSTMQTFAVQSTAPIQSSPIIFTGAAPPPTTYSICGVAVAFFAVLTAVFLI